jgi:hypothetical protein
MQSIIKEHKLSMYVVSVNTTYIKFAHIICKVKYLLNSDVTSTYIYIKLYDFRIPVFKCYFYPNIIIVLYRLNIVLEFHHSSQLVSLSGSDSHEFCKFEFHAVIFTVILSNAI